MTVLVDVAAAARAVNRTKSTVYLWADRGLLTKHHTSPKRYMVDLDEVITVDAATPRHSDRQHAGGCVITYAGEPCDAPTWDALRWPVCQRHALDIYTTVSDMNGHAP